MRPRYALHLVAAAVILVSIAACTPSAPASSLTQAAPKTESTKATAPQAAPTQVTSAQPTTSAKTIDFPTKGKTIMFNVPWPAGGSNDISARLLAPILARELGTNVEIVNKGGASSQVGMTDLINSKEDGYMLGQASLPTLSTVYLQADRKAIFDRKSFEPVAQQSEDGSVIAVKADSPYKTLQDVIDDAKKNPDKVTIGSDPWLNFHQFTVAQLEQAAGVRFASVQFNGSAEKQTSLIGGHVAVAATSVADVTPFVQNGSVRVLAIASASESTLMPGVKTMKSLGYDSVSIASRGFALKSGTPKTIVDIWAGALKKAINDPEFVTRMKAAGQEVKYLAPAEYASYWDGVDAQVKKMVEAGPPNGN